MIAQSDSPGLRELIREQATRLFATRGFAGTSIRHVVEACACTKPALYYYFASKEALFRDVVQHHISAFDRMVGQAVASTGSVRERIHHLNDDIVGHCEANPCAVRLLHRLETSPEDTAPAIDAETARACHMEQMARLIAQGVASGELRDDISPEDATLVLVAVMHMHFELSTASGEWDRERIHRTMDLVLDGIAR